MSTPSPYGSSDYPNTPQGGYGPSPQSAYPYSLQQQPGAPAAPPPGAYASAGGPAAPGIPLGAAVKPLNIMGVIGLVFVIVSDLIGPFRTILYTGDFDVAAANLYSGIFGAVQIIFTIIALVFGIIGLMRKETRAYWVAIVATAMAAWNLTFTFYAFLVQTIIVSSMSTHPAL